jgi:hypothetical protein
VLLHSNSPLPTLERKEFKRNVISVLRVIRGSLLPCAYLAATQVGYHEMQSIFQAWLTTVILMLNRAPKPSCLTFFTASSRALPPRNYCTLFDTREPSFATETYHGHLKNLARNLSGEASSYNFLYTAVHSWSTTLTIEDSGMDK